MASVGVILLIGLAGLAVAFMALSSRHGIASAFKWFCWVPLAALVTVLLQHKRMGLDVLIVLALILVTDLYLVALGVFLSIKARRRKDTATGAMIGATLVAAIPLLLLSAQWMIETLRKR